MMLLFGMACDGPTFPDFPGDAEGVLDADVVGPVGLLDAIEVQLGLAGPRRSHSSRVACYLADMRGALEADPGLFFAGSAGVDPWGTARTLLAWRDDLVAGGWSGCPAASERIDALASIAAVGGRLPAGIADRIAVARRALAAGPSLGIGSLGLIGKRASLPPCWRGLVDALEACGVQISERPRCAIRADGDLGRLQRFLAGGGVEPLAGDGRVALVRADTALAAAEAVAEWIAHGPEEELDGTVVLSADGDTALLDQALRARGLPALGQSSASPWRGALQVLPLAMAAAWAPFDAKAMLELLLLPRPPIPRRVARRLAGALSREPGTGGSEWSRAWNAIEADVADEVDAGTLDRAAADRRLSEWRDWTSGDLHQRSAGMPAEAARAIAARVQAWAFAVDAGAGDPLLLTAAAAAGALIEAIDLVGIDTLPALLLERMLDEVLGDGAQNPDHVPTAGGLRSVRHPGAVWAQVPRLVWWDFKGPGEGIPSFPWSRAEVAALEAVGCRLESPAERAERIGLSCVNAILATGERLMLVTPAFSGGEPATSHPLEHQLQPLVSRSRSLVTWSAERLFGECEVSLLGRDLRREPVEVIAPPRQRTVWTLPESVRRRLVARVESATSLERLADCQMRWLLLDVIGLSGGRFAEVPDANQLLGNLAHELAREVLRPGVVPAPDDVLARVEARFGEVVAAIAAPLQRPEHAAELAAARFRLPRSLASLAGVLRGRSVEIVGTELERHRGFADGLAVAGRLDLVVRHPVRGLGVVDLKWSRSGKRRRDEIADGRSLQLATYGEIADLEGAMRAEGAYYLLAQRRMIGPRDGFLADEAIRSGRGLAATWDAMVDTWRAWRDLALSGTLVASGTRDAVGHVPANLGVAPGAEPCRFCELVGLCRVREEEN